MIHPNPPACERSERRVCEVGASHGPDMPAGYFSPFVVFPRGPVANTLQTTPNRPTTARPKPILIPQRSGPLPILPRGQVPLSFQLPMGTFTLIPIMDAVKGPAVTNDERQRETRKRSLSPKMSGPIQRTTVSFQHDKKLKTRSGTSRKPTIGVLWDDLYAKIACITQHPSSVLIPNSGNKDNFVLPNNIQDDSVAQKLPFETIQTIDVLVSPNEEAHTGNKMFHSLVCSYQSIYHKCSKARRQELTRNLAAFLRLQGVRFLMQGQDGRFYECGTERLELKIFESLSCHHSEK